MRLLHVFFSSVLKPQHKFLGTTKDIRGHTQYFIARGIEYEELVLKIRKERYFFERLHDVDLDRFDVVFCEGAYYPGVVRHLKARHPRLRVLMRGINAEILHWLHSAHAALRYDTWRRFCFDVWGTIDYGWKDFLCARRADAILAICRWEAERYWPRLAPRERIANVPYFLPDAYLQDIPAARPRRDNVVCMMTTKAGRPFLTDAARNLYRLVEGLGGGEAHWTFSVTGDFKADRLAPCDRVRVLGFLENPLEHLAESRAVALLSDYGFGFKTKLLEALCCGCYLLVTRKLHERLPAVVQERSFVVDVRSVESFRAALARCAEPFPAGDPNRTLREEAYAALDRVLGLQPTVA